MFKSASPSRGPRARSGYAAALLGVALCPAVGLGQELLTIHGTALESYQASATRVQDALPSLLLRGAYVDGSTAGGAGSHLWPAGANPAPDAWNRHGMLGDVRLASGTYDRTYVDLALPSIGVPWVIGRTFLSNASTAREGPQGTNWHQSSQPEIFFYDHATNSLDMVYLVYGADRYLEFQRQDGSATTFIGVNGSAGIFSYVSGSPDRWEYYDTRGYKTTFFGGNTSSNRADWQIWKIEDAAGNVAYVGDATTASTAVSGGYDASGRILYAYDMADRRYSYAYSGSAIGSAVRLTQVKAETKSSGTWASPSGVVEVGRVDYDYYTTKTTVGGVDIGDEGDLKLVTVTTPLTDSGVNLVTKQYFMYYFGSYTASDNLRGNPHQLRMVVDPEGYRAYDMSAGGGLDDDPLSASVADLKPYAEAYFEYVSGGDLRMASSFFSGQCGCGGGSANGTHAFTYEAAPGFSNTSNTYDNGPALRTIVEMPDGSFVSQYFDEAGQPLSRVVSDITTGSATNVWPTAVTRIASGSDGAGTIDSIKSAANATAYTHASSSITASTSAGTIDAPVRETTADIKGLPLTAKIKVGTSDGGAPVTAREWSKRQLVVVSGTNLTRAYQSKTKQSADGSTWIESSITQAFWSATNTDRLYLAPQVVTSTRPKVPTSENGRGNGGGDPAILSKSFVRRDGTVAFTLRPEYSGASSTDLVYTYTKHDAQGRVVMRIDDVNPGSGDIAGADQTDMGGSFWNIGTSSNAAAKHAKTEFTYDAQGRLDTTTHPDGLVTKIYYSKLVDGRMVTIGCPRVVAGSPTYYGPMSYTVTNLAGMTEFGGTVAISNSGITTALTGWVDETEADPITALDIGTLSGMSTFILSKEGRRVESSRLYHTIPSSGTGSAGTNFDATVYGYDDLGRQWRVKNPAGTITRTVFDAIGRFSARWIGTNDNSFSGGEGSGPDNMVKAEEVEYDGGASGGKANSLVTKRTAFIQDTTTGRRDTVYAYDTRNRPYKVTNPQTPHAVTMYDNLGRAVATAGYTDLTGITASTDIAASSSSNRVSLSRTFFDVLGQPYEQRAYQIVQSSGAIAGGGTDVYLPLLTTYDAQGRVVRTRGTSLSKTVYDRLGRVTDQFTLAKDNDTTYADAADVTGDTVLEETHTYYQDSTGLPLFTHSVQRNFDDTSTTGALDGNGDTDRSTVTAANVKGRVWIAAFYYDALHRQTHVAVHGTHAIVGDGSTSTGTFTRPGSATRSATELVTTTTYDTDGTVLETTDPKGIVTRFLYDDAGRKVADIRNYLNGTPSGPTGDDDVFTRYTYSAGRMTEMWVDLDGDGTKDAGPPADQVTTYTYGITKGASAGDSKISSNDLLWKVTYPDSSSGSDLVTFAYNAQGQEVWKKDQAGNVLESDYDTGGRRTGTRATTINTGAGFDDAVKRISLTYLPRGLVSTVTQHDATTSGTILNEVKYEYDDWGNISKVLQDRDGDVNTSGGHNEAQVAFAYSTVTTTDGSKRARIQRDSMTLPKTLGASDGASVAYTFGTGGNIAETFGRVSKVSVGGTDVASYEYQGSGTLVTTALKTATADTAYRLHSGTSGSGFGGHLDTFGRVTRSQWQKLLGTPVTLYDVTLTYDENGNITSADDAVTGSGSGFDAKYAMDNLNRLIDADEGTLSAGSIGSRTRRERWDQNTSGLGLDQVGNWMRRKLDLDGDGNYTSGGELDDTGAFNAANEWLTRDTDSNSSVNYTLAHDAVGNMTDDGKDYTYVYDVFGRLVKVKARGSGNTVAEYAYDGLGQRVFYHADEDADGTVEASNDDPKYNFVYDDRWRIVATYRVPYSGGVDATPKDTFVWHVAGVDGQGGSSYIDSVILRDRDANGGSPAGWRGASDGTLEERRFYLQNWRADVSAVCNTNGRPLERVKYSAYGTPITLTDIDYNADGSLDPDDPGDFVNSPYDWNLDGTTDSADDDDFFDDYSAVSGNAFGRGYLSLAGIGNRLGYAGYVFDRFISGSDGAKWHVRHRVLDSGLGRWTRRDPLGYVDGMGLYEYVASRPTARSDPTGLAMFNWTKCLSRRTVALCQSCCQEAEPADRDRCRTACDNVFTQRPATGVHTCMVDDVPGMDVRAACERIRRECNREGWAFPICFRGRCQPCGNGDTITTTADRWAAECIQRHEEYHCAQGDCSGCPTGKVCHGEFRKGVRPGAEECQATYVELQCLSGKCNLVNTLARGSGITCEQAIDRLNKAMSAACDYMEHHCGVRPAACACTVSCR